MVVASERKEGGSRLTSTTRDRLATDRRRILELIERVRTDWQARMEGVDVHAFRKTHQTWAEAEGVPAVLIDKQLGHSMAGGSHLEVFRAVRASRVGRKHYLDLGSQLLDPTPAAEAVRALLDDALAELQAAPRETASVMTC